MRIQRWMAIAASVVLPLAASAQGAAGGAAGGNMGAGGAGGGAGGYGAAGGAAGGMARPGGQTGGVAQIGGGPNTFAAGVINGTVEAVNAPRGVVRLRTGQGVVSVNAMPSQISALNPGDVVSLQYANFNGTLWVAERGNQSAFANVPYTNEGRLTGEISRLGRARGIITVRGTTFRIHPQTLQGLIPGQFVSVTYANVDGINWVGAVTPAAGAPAAGPAARGALSGQNNAGEMGAGGAANGAGAGAAGNTGAGGAGAGAAGNTGAGGAGAGGTGAGGAGGGVK